MAVAYTNSYRNIGFPNGPVFRYGNFFIPRVEKSSKISPRAKNLVLPRAVGPREARFFSQGLIFEDFSTRGMKKFSYLKITAHSEIVFLYELTKQKIREIVDALVKRNQISTWPMWKSDFRMGHVEI